MQGVLMACTVLKTYFQHHYLQFDRIPEIDAVEICSWLCPMNKIHFMIKQLNVNKMKSMF